jgi:hypothetical protein
MQTYSVDDELAAFIEHAAREKPFEHLSFNDALWRVMRRFVIGEQSVANPSGQTLGERHNQRAELEARVKELAEHPLGESEPAQEAMALGPLDGSATLGRTVNLRSTRPQLHADLNAWLAELRTKQPKKAPSPSARLWANSVQDLKDKNLSDWKEICDHLGLDPAGDSARRCLKKWVKINRPSWTPVPNP